MDVLPVTFLLLQLLGTRAGVQAATVGYDQRALLVNGQRRILISGSIHYPRAAPEMWPDLIAKAKAGGLDVIDTYVFWDGHEPTKGSYNFEGRFDLVGFVKLVQEAGMYVNLRIGPYVCAEWNFGGLPVWLKDITNMQFRTNNQAFKEKMEEFVTFIVAKMKSEKLFAPQGGPIILAQIENEFGYRYGNEGKSYMLWAASMAQSLNTGVPWIMCNQPNAPEHILNTCNGFYCDKFVPADRHKPKLWTESYTGWFQKWGQPKPQRPVQDIAFAVARFFQRGGSFQNYYMYFGGTNFGRTSGGPYITTSYDYDAPINEYGLVQEPKWGHLKSLHEALKLSEAVLVSNDPVRKSLGSFQEAHVYGNTTNSSSDSCVAFLANVHPNSSATVKFNGQFYALPAWSVSILPGCAQVSYNTAKVNIPKETISPVMKKCTSPKLVWETYQEPVGVWGACETRAAELLEQVGVTKDTTDYLWYSTSFNISREDIASGSPVVEIEAMRDVVHVFTNGQYAGTTATDARHLYGGVKQSVELVPGENSLDILSVTVGLQNSGYYFENRGAGLNGSISLKGLPSGDIDLTTKEWAYQVGLQGENLTLFAESGSQGVRWSSYALTNKPLVWYKTRFEAPSGSEAVAVDLGCMGKGHAWVNGRSIGRFWPSFITQRDGCSESCDYRGKYSPSKCTTGCGQPSQEWYHVPRSWLRGSDNLLVMFEEVGGDPSCVSFLTASNKL